MRKPVTALPVLARAWAGGGISLRVVHSWSFPGFGVLCTVFCMYNARRVDGRGGARGNNIQNFSEGCRKKLAGGLLRLQVGRKQETSAH